jgi:thioredoxin reductase
MLQPVIIIGAGLAGWTSAREFRTLDMSTPVMLITVDTGDFYEAVPAQRFGAVMTSKCFTGG